MAQLTTFEASALVARTRGIIPAPESSHAIRAAVNHALQCRQTGRAEDILFTLSGHGHFDMSAYDQYFAGKLEDHAYPSEDIAQALERLPKVQ